MPLRDVEEYGREVRAERQITQALQCSHSLTSHYVVTARNHLPETSTL
jgi:hypothetical protein